MAVPIKNMIEPKTKSEALDTSPILRIDRLKPLLPRFQTNLSEKNELPAIITEWNQFRALDMEKVKSLLKSPKIADLRNIYEPADMREMGFEYVGVGR